MHALTMRSRLREASRLFGIEPRFSRRRTRSASHARCSRFAWRPPISSCTHTSIASCSGCWPRSAHLHGSSRQLQRRLRDAGTSFQALLEGTRHDLALRYLDEPHMTLSEVGFLLGFAEPSTFHRAFKRWTGTTPVDYRQGGHRTST